MVGLYGSILNLVEDKNRKERRLYMTKKEYKYRGFDEPIKVDEKGNATYRGREVEKYFHGYKTVGMASGFSYTQLAKAHYIEEMQRIDEDIRQEEYRKKHQEEFENLETAEESLKYFFDMVV